jgi:hypothetical protein
MTSVRWWVASLFCILVTPSAASWVVARTHRVQQAAMLLAFLSCELV